MPHPVLLPSLSLASEIAILRDALDDLVTAPDDVRAEAATRAVDITRVVTVIIHAIAAERAYHADRADRAASPDPATDAAARDDPTGTLAPILARALAELEHAESHGT